MSVAIMVLSACLCSHGLWIRHHFSIALGCRELTGQGFYSWVKGGLQQRLRDAQSSSGSISVQVETLAGHPLTINVVRTLQSC